MQIINVNDNDVQTAATNLKNALTQYASGYFDSYETDFTSANGEKIVNCMIGQTAAVRFVYKSELYYFKLSFEQKALYCPTQMDRVVIAYVCVFDNAILLVPSTVEYSTPILLCKRRNGDTCITFLTNAANTLLESAAAGNAFYGTVSVNRSTGAVDYDSNPVVFTSNSSGGVAGYTPFSKNDGITLKDVYVVTDSDFRSHSTPLVYAIGDKIYTGIAGNYFAVKGT